MSEQQQAALPSWNVDRGRGSSRHGRVFVCEAADGTFMVRYQFGRGATSATLHGHERSICQGYGHKTIAEAEEAAKTLMDMYGYRIKAHH